ncbi:MAG: GNAT family N-acetyltransferase [Deltaproteobacteria bacterium]|nr:GNAT family N-acetyltransferase [Deltaproteobacteria bacterium]
MRTLKMDDNRSTSKPSLRRLGWDSEMLGLCCGIIDCSILPAEASKIDPFAKIEKLLAQGSEYDLIALKLPSLWPDTVNRLVRDGARLIETELVFAYSGGPVRGDASSVRFSSRVEAAAFTPLAAMMQHSRLFIDPAIPHERALRLWIKSIKNYCEGRADDLAVAFHDGRPAGLTTLNFLETGAVNLHIVGVLKKHQGQGVGRAMMSAVAQKYGRDHAITVETLSANTPAQHLYQKSGFQLVAVQHVLHAWNPGRP